MAQHKSAEKRARQSVKRAARNASVKGAVKTAEKKLRVALAAGDSKTAKDLLKKVTSQMSKAKVKGAIHAKTAARKISRLATRVHQLAK